MQISRNGEIVVAVIKVDGAIRLTAATNIYDKDDGSITPFQTSTLAALQECCRSR